MIENGEVEKFVFYYLAPVVVNKLKLRYIRMLDLMSDLLLLFEVHTVL